MATPQASVGLQCSRSDVAERLHGRPDWGRRQAPATTSEHPGLRLSLDVGRGRVQPWRRACRLPRVVVTWERESSYGGHAQDATTRTIKFRVFAGTNPIPAPIPSESPGERGPHMTTKKPDIATKKPGMTTELPRLTTPDHHAVPSGPRARRRRAAIGGRGTPRPDAVAGRGPCWARRVAARGMLDSSPPQMNCVIKERLDESTRRGGRRTPPAIGRRPPSAIERATGTGGPSVPRVRRDHGELSDVVRALCRAGRRAQLARPVGALDLVLLALATVRLSRLAAWEGVTSFMRLPLVEHDSPDDPITGPEQRPRGRGFLRAFGELILCTTCVGTWISALLTYGLYLAPSFTRPFLTIMATAALSQASDAALALVYSSRDSRTCARRRPISRARPAPERASGEDRRRASRRLAYSVTVARRWGERSGDVALAVAGAGRGIRLAGWPAPGWSAPRTRAGGCCLPPSGQGRPAPGSAWRPAA